MKERLDDRDLDLDLDRGPRDLERVWDLERERDLETFLFSASDINFA